MILRSKLTPPVLAAAYIDRPRLYQELERWRSLRALLVRAPPGYGKSSLVSRWLQISAEQVSAAWLSLDEYDSDPCEFVRYLAAALEPFAPAVLESLRPLLDDVRCDAQRALQKLLLDLQEALAPDAAVGERHVLLVLDDVHLLQSDAIDALLMRLLEQGPPQMHLCLLSRRPLSLPLARMFAHGQVHELTVDDLRFTADEVRRYVVRRGFARPNKDELAEIMLRSEGWVTALQLASIARRGSSHITTLIEHLHGDSRWLAQYLTSEALVNQPPELRRFLLHTSILDSFNAELCAAVTEVDSAYHLLAAIAQADLFLIGLDERQEWFRYHHFFQELLQRRLREAESQPVVNALHRRAAAWFADADRIREAVQHLRAAGDDAAALDLVAERVLVAFRRNPAQARQWFELFPQDVLAGHPRLMLNRCRLESLFGSLQLMMQVERTATAIAGAQLPATEVAELQARLQVYRTMASFYQADMEATARYCNQALIGLVYLDTFETGVLEFVRMHMCGYAGRYSELQHHAARAMAAFAGEQFTIGIIALRRELAIYAFRAGNSDEADQHFRTLFAEPHNDRRFVGHELLVSYLDAAEQSYWRNHLSQARSYVQQACILGQDLQNEPLLEVTTWYRSHYNRIEVGQSPTRCDTEELPLIPAHIHRYVGVQIRLLLRLEQREQAWQIASRLGVWLDSNPAYWHNRVLLPFLWAFIARGRDLAAADSLMEQALVQRRSTGDRFAELQLLALRAWQQFQLGRQATALVTLTSAARLALETGYVRVILDVPALLPLLDQISDPAISIRALRSNRQPDQAHIRLTDQQHAVLYLLASNYRYEQIANELLISINTVRTHVRHIYKKMGAHRRDEVLEQARQAGLLA